jgi:dTDP-4-amino-4,6-dideoxygalactose transaminase
MAMVAAGGVNVIPLFKPAITEVDVRAVAKVIRSGMVGPGEVVLQFEKELAAKCRRRYCLATNSGTSALMLVMMAATKPGDAVVCPAYSHPAPANAIGILGRKLVLCDVDGMTGCMDLATLRDIPDEARIAVYVEHNGFCGGTLEFVRQASKQGLVVVQDSSQSLGNKGAGGAGAVSVLSFSPQKIVTTGQGGAVLTNNAELHRALAALRNQGIEPGPGLPKKHRSQGVNLRMSDVQAALGLSMLGRIDAIAKQLERSRLWWRDYFSTVNVHDWCPSIRARNADAIVRELRDHRIEAARLYEPVAANPTFGHDPNQFPCANSTARQTVYVPGFATLRYADFQRARRAVQQHDTDSAAPGDGRAR